MNISGLKAVCNEHVVATWHVSSVASKLSEGTTLPILRISCDMYASSVNSPIIPETVPT